MFAICYLLRGSCDVVSHYLKSALLVVNLVESTLKYVLHMCPVYMGAILFSGNLIHPPPRNAYSIWPYIFIILHEWPVLQNFGTGLRSQFPSHGHC